MQSNVNRQPIFLAWEGSSFFAWGLIGLHIAMQWCSESKFLPVMLRLDPAELFLDPLRVALLQPALRVSAAIAPRISGVIPHGRLKLDIPVVYSMGNNAGGAFNNVQGSRNIGRIVFEDTRFDKLAIARLRAMDAITTISRWNADLIECATNRTVDLNHEGVDSSMFSPGPRSGLMDSSRFYIFSGGKAEFRKGQDLVLAAFKIFSARHPEAVLVTAWQSPFPQIGVGLQGALKSALQLDATGRSLDIKRWALDNEIDPLRIIEIGLIPNLHMAALLREMDCAICASRAEGGTNLPIMEAMACGVPTIFPNNTGMQDLLCGDGAVVLQTQAPVRPSPTGGTDGWGESSIDEIVDALERLFSSTDLRKHVGGAGAEFIRQRNWQRHARRLGELAVG